MSQLHGNKFSAFLTDTNKTQTMGFVLGAVSSKTNTRTDSLNAYNQNVYGPTTYPFSGGPNAVPLAATPCCITFGSIFDDKKRDAFTGSLEWRPNSAFQLVADGIYTHLNDPQYGYNESYYFAAANPTGYPLDESGGQERRRDRRHCQRLPAGNGECHHESAGQYLAVRIESDLEAG